MLCWALKANFTNLSRRTTQAISFHDMTAESAGNEMKSVNHVHAHCVTNLPAPCREGERDGEIKMRTETEIRPTCVAPRRRDCGLRLGGILCYVAAHLWHWTTFCWKQRTR